MRRQDGVCLLCSKPLANDGKCTHIDHHKTVEEFVGKVFRGELTFDDAYLQLWDDSNLRAVCHKCNYDRRTAIICAGSEVSRH